MIRRRDGNKCKICASIVNLEVHHIMRWQDFPHMRFWIGNGITLCKKCHVVVTGREYEFAAAFKRMIDPDAKK
jgi:5-methylcytosine-specific restriction endonuclease McrA